MRNPIILAPLFLAAGLVVGFYLTSFMIDSPREIHSDFDESFSSVCYIHSGTEGAAASGVMLKSGYVLTAAHLIDDNNNGKLDPEERAWEVEFPSINEESFKTIGRPIAVSDHTPDFSLDIAILKLDEKPPIAGVNLIEDLDYYNLKTGEPIDVIGMMNNRIPASITSGRITSFRLKEAHRTNATAYMGSSGGGVFNKNQELIGIETKIGVAREHIHFGPMAIPFIHFLPNISFYSPATRIRYFLKTNGLAEMALDDSVWLLKWYHFLGLTIMNLLFAFGVFKGFSYLEEL